MAIHLHLAALLLLTTSPLSAQTTPAPTQTLLGQGRGVDHVAVVVRDLSQAERDYEQLGFKVAGRKHFPGGEFDSHVYLQDNSYLELLSVSTSVPIKKGMASAIATFLKTHEGAVFLGIDVSSAKAAADYLKARNFAVDDPHPGSSMEEGETTLPPPMWYTVGINDAPAAGKKGITIPIFLIEYVSAAPMEKHRAAGDMAHPNTAMGIHAVWFAVHDTKAQLRALRDAGLETGDSREVKFLSAHGREVKADQGVLLLLESSDKNGMLTKYLSDHHDWIEEWPHDEGIIGLSIKVADLGKARRLAESGTGRKLETYKGFYGTSFRLPPDVTHGVWMEMYQPAEHSH
jgi:catechol 2,3-dioxygenase-like lactoylglutathione lyase family enzyme